MESEKDTERFLCRKIRELGGKAYKFVSPGCTGVPDRLVCLPGGRIFFVELKSEGKESTENQKHRQRELRDLGLTVYADIDTKAKVMEVIGREIHTA